MIYLLKNMRIFAPCDSILCYVKLCSGLVLVAGISVAVHSRICRYKEFRKLAKLRKRRQEERFEALQKLKNAFEFTPEFQAITELSMELLTEKLQSRELSATKVLSAFISKAVLINEEFNCITEFAPQAQKWATELDALPEIRGPLHGIPISVKEDTDLEGLDTTRGLSCNLYKPATESAVLVKVLMDLGVVPFCKTNVPQTCCSYGSENPIYGRTLNPLNKSLSPGGSSSGTGCLVAAGGVPFGTGADTGGSLRLPAHFNGISTLKPTLNRLSRKGLHKSTTNSVGFGSAGGVLAKQASEVSNIFKAMTEHNQHNRYDGTVAPIQWNDALFSSNTPLRIGYFTAINGWPLLGDTEETLLRAKSALEFMGHTVVPFEMPDSRWIAKVKADIYGADLGKHALQDLQHDQVSEIIESTYKVASTPIWKRRLLTSIPILGRRYADLKEGMDTRFSAEFWDAITERDAIINQVLENIRKLNLDLILCPAFPFPAPGIDNLSITGGGLYLYAWYVVDFPAGIVTFGTESGKHYKISDDLINFYGLEEMFLKNATGMPIGIQLVGKPFYEETVLRAMVQLESYYLQIK